MGFGTDNPRVALSTTNHYGSMRLHAAEFTALSNSAPPCKNVLEVLDRASEHSSNAGPGSRPGQMWVIWVTARFHETSSPPSEQATVCIG